MKYRIENTKTRKRHYNNSSEQSPSIASALIDWRAQLYSVGRRCFRRWRRTALAAAEALVHRAAVHLLGQRADVRRLAHLLALRQQPLYFLDAAAHDAVDLVRPLGEHEPDEQGELALVVARRLREEHVRVPLEERDEEEYHPEGQPLTVVVAARRLDRTDQEEDTAHAGHEQPAILGELAQALRVLDAVRAGVGLRAALPVLQLEELVGEAALWLINSRCKSSTLRGTFLGEKTG